MLKDRTTIAEQAPRRMKIQRISRNFICTRKRSWKMKAEESMSWMLKTTLPRWMEICYIELESPHSSSHHLSWSRENPTYRQEIVFIILEDILLPLLAADMRILHRVTSTSPDLPNANATSTLQMRLLGLPHVSARVVSCQRLQVPGSL